MGLLTNYTRSLLWLAVLLASVLVGAGLTTALEVGDRAPDFLLPSTMGG